MKAIQIAFKEMIFRWRTSLMMVVIVAIITGVVSFFAVNRTGFTREIKRNVRDIGSNVVILPAQVDQVAYHNNGGFSDQTMTSEVVDQLLAKKASLNHLIPMLEQRSEVAHGEKKQVARIIGISASIPMPGRPKAPMQKAVKEGTVQLGSALADQLGVQKDKPAKVLIANQSLPVSRVNRSTGTWQDSAVFMELALAQQVFGKPDQISRIEAIECTSEKCAELGLTSTVVLQNEIANITDLAQILRRRDMAEARASVRNVSEANLNLLTNVMWILLIASTTFLAAWNTVQRKSEIGVFRAIGFGRTRILGILLSRAIILSLVGATTGVLVGSMTSVWQANSVFAQTGKKVSVDFLSMLWITLIAILLSGLATLVPAVLAASRHPAQVIGKDAV